MRKIKSYQTMVFFILIVAISFTLAAAYAYWLDVQNNNNVKIKFGDEASLEVKDVSQSYQGKLVPLGRAKAKDEVEVVTFAYQVGFLHHVQQTMNLHVEAVEVQFLNRDGSEDEALKAYHHLVEIFVQGSKDQHVYELFNSVITVYVDVKLQEPIDQTEVDAAEIKGITLMKNVENARLAFELLKDKQIEVTIRFSTQAKTNQI